MSETEEHHGSKCHCGSYAAVGEKDTSKAHRAKIAAANGITNYAYTAAQNTKMVNLLKKGKLIKA
jgi:hypothetical protein